MELTANFYKVLPMIIYFISVMGSVGAGIFLYNGLTTPTEKIQTRLRFRRGIKENRDQFLTILSESTMEKRLKEAGNPLKLNAIRYMVFRWIITLVLIFNYYLVPYFLQQDYNSFAVIGILVFFIFTMPEAKFSATHILLNKIIEYRKAKLNSEIFILHDLLVGEIEMMSHSRINTYNLIRQLIPYFDYIRPHMNQLMAQWVESGPDQALDNFAKELDTKEAVSLVSVLKTLDYNERGNALKALKGMGDLFVRKQIENYRRKKKLLVDVYSIPINSAVFITMLNFLLIIVYMVLGVLGDGTSSL